ncbi:hypothetical protein KY334_02335 [Candidatus Woesearchaeota archaeon]|nr:hypothetical protein [Candidatus Woesearchaeota archaeon]
MTDLVACLSTGKGTWTEVIKLIQTGTWDNVYLITNQFGKDNFKADEKTKLIVINDFEPIEKISQTIYNNLKGKIAWTDIAVNFVSGSGKEHMALLPALLKLGVGIRIVTVDDGKIKEVLFEDLQPKD